MASSPAPLEKVRVLRSEELKHGQPQYYTHLAKPPTPLLSAYEEHKPYAISPDVSRKFGQHLIIFRGQQPKPGAAGNVFVQDAFDREGRLRLSTDEHMLTHPGVRVKSWPAEESDGSIYIYFGEGQKGVKQVVEVDDSGCLPRISNKNPLQQRLTDASRSIFDRKLKDEIALQNERRSQAAAARAAQGMSPFMGADMKKNEATHDHQVDVVDLHGGVHATDGVHEAAQRRDHVNLKSPAPVSPYSASGAWSPLRKSHRLALPGDVRLEGATDPIQTPQDSSRSSWGSPRSQVSGVSEMLREMEASKRPQKDDSKARSAKEDAEAAAVVMTEALRKEKKEKEEQEQQTLKNDIRRAKDAVKNHKRVIIKKQADADYAELERAKAEEEMKPVMEKAAALHKKLQEFRDRTEVQKKLLERYKKEHGEKGLFKSLKREMYEEREKMRKVEEDLAEVEPKERSRQKHLKERTERVVVAQRVLKRANERMKALEERLEDANAALEDFRLRMLDETDDDPLMHGPATLTRAATFRASKSTRDLTHVALSADVFDNEADPGWQHADKPHVPGEDANTYKYFVTSEAILRRSVLIARAKSPRWRQRMQEDLDRYVSFKTSVIRPPDYVDDVEPIMSDARMAIPTYFDCRIKVPKPLAVSFEIFCRAPPPPFEACTRFDVLTDTIVGQVVNIEFKREPGGFLTNLLKAFSRPEHCGKDQQMYLDQMCVVASEKREVTNYASLRERWATEGLSHDIEADEALMNLKYRCQETWYKRFEMDVHDHEYRNMNALPIKPNMTTLWACELFKSCRIDFMEALEKIVAVIQVPAQERLIDQGTICDTMFIIAQGSLLCHRISCSQQPARPDEAGSVYSQSDQSVLIAILVHNSQLDQMKQVLGPCESFGEQCLLEDVVLESSYETLEDSTLYRIRRDAYLSILPRFPDEYKKLIELSFKRCTEWKTNSLSLRKVPMGKNARWGQLSGIAYSERGTLKGGRRSADEVLRSHDHMQPRDNKGPSRILFSTKQAKEDGEVYECHVTAKRHAELPPSKSFVDQIMEDRESLGLRAQERAAYMAHGGVAEAGERNVEEDAIERMKAGIGEVVGDMVDKTVKWGVSGLQLSTAKTDADLVLGERELRSQDWWRDTTREMSTSAIALAKDFVEKADAMERRCGANTWRVANLKRIGKNMIDQIR